MGSLSEDDIFRSSSQYRLWTFTKRSLASLRSTTNELAADGVRSAIQSLHAQRSKANPGNEASKGEMPEGSNPDPEVDCLMVAEEQKLVGFYCVKAMQFSDFCEFPTNVKVSSPVDPSRHGGILMQSHRRQQSNS